MGSAAYRRTAGPSAQACSNSTRGARPARVARIVVVRFLPFAPAWTNLSPLPRRTSKHRSRMGAPDGHQNAARAALRRGRQHRFELRYRSAFYFHVKRLTPNHMTEARAGQPRLGKKSECKSWRCVRPQGDLRRPPEKRFESKDTPRPASIRAPGSGGDGVSNGPIRGHTRVRRAHPLPASLVG